MPVTTEENAQQFPDVVYNSHNNQFLAVWEHVEQDYSRDIYGILLDGDSGQPIGEPILFIVDDNIIEAPELAYNSVDNEYLLVARSRYNNMAFAQRVSAQGTADW